MKVKYVCTSGACRIGSGQRHKIEMPAELVMDDHNIATMFCPKCKKRLVRAK